MLIFTWALLLVIPCYVEPLFNQCNELVKLQLCPEAGERENLVDARNRLQIEATCNFTASVARVSATISEGVYAVYIQHTCRDANGTELPRPSLTDVTDLEDHGVTIEIDSSADMCIFYTCFKADSPKQLSRTCYYNSTSIATCAKDHDHYSSSRISVLPTKTVSHSSTPTLIYIPTLNKKNSSETHLSLTSKHELSGSFISTPINSEMLASTGIPQQTVENLPESGGVSTGAVLGIIASVGLMLILIVAGISVLALWYSCGAGHKQMLKRHILNENFPDFDTDDIYNIEFLEVKMTSYDVVTICSSLESKEASQEEKHQMKNDTKLPLQGCVVDTTAKDNSYCAFQSCLQVPTTTLPSTEGNTFPCELESEESVSPVPLSAKSIIMSDGYIESTDICVSTSTNTTGVPICSNPHEEVFVDELEQTTEPNLQSDGESLCMSPDVFSSQNDCSSQISCYSDFQTLPAPCIDLLQATSDPENNDRQITMSGSVQLQLFDDYIQSEHPSGTFSHNLNSNNELSLTEYGHTAQCSAVYTDDPMDYRGFQCDANTSCYITSDSNLCKSAQQPTAYKTHATNPSSLNYQPLHANTMASEYIDSQHYLNPPSYSLQSERQNSKQSMLSTAEYCYNIDEWASLESLPTM